MVRLAGRRVRAIGIGSIFYAAGSTTTYLRQFRAEAGQFTTRWKDAGKREIMPGYQAVDGIDPILVASERTYSFPALYVGIEFPHDWAGLAPEEVVQITLQVWGKDVKGVDLAGLQCSMGTLPNTVIQARDVRIAAVGTKGVQVTAVADRIAPGEQRVGVYLYLDAAKDAFKWSGATEFALTWHVETEVLDVQQRVPEVAMVWHAEEATPSRLFSIGSHDSMTDSEGWRVMNLNDVMDRETEWVSPYTVIGDE